MPIKPMRVRRLTYIPSLINLQDTLSLESLEDFAFAIKAPDSSEDPNEVVATEIFQKLVPGEERICVILKADGLSHESIAEVMGIPEARVRLVFSQIRQRLTGNQSLD